MGKQFAWWFLAALAAGIGLLLLGSWFRVGGLPPAWSQALHGPAPSVNNAAGQVILHEQAPAAPSDVLVLKPGDQVPADYALPSLDGQPQTLAQYRGKLVLLNFWATWCQPCLQEMPELVAAQKRHAAHAQVIGIAMDSPDNIRAWLKHTPVDYPIWLGMGGDQQPTVTFGNTAGLLPYSVLIDAQGRIVTTHMGKLDHKRLEQWLGVDAAADNSSASPRAKAE